MYLEVSNLPSHVDLLYLPLGPAIVRIGQLQPVNAAMVRPQPGDVVSFLGPLLDVHGENVVVGREEGRVGLQVEAPLVRTLLHYGIDLQQVSIM